MIIKELKNNILLALYDRYKKGNTSPIEFDKLCLSNAIIYDSDKQLSDAVESLTYIIHSGFISGYQNRYGDNLKPPTNVYHRMTA